MQMNPISDCLQPVIENTTQTKIFKQYKVNIDFDHASRMWRANKRVPINSISFKYCCGALKKDGSFCSAPPHIWKRSLKAKRDFKYCWGFI